jgi:hypothetical protein
MKKQFFLAGIFFPSAVSPVVNSYSKSKSSGQQPRQANLVGTCKLTAETDKPATGAKFDEMDILEPFQRDDRADSMQIRPMIIWIRE